MQKMTKDEIKVGDKFEPKKGPILTVVAITPKCAMTECGDITNVYRIDNLLSDNFKKIEEPKYIENTEKVKWAMNNMKRAETIKRIRDAFPNMIVKGEYKVSLCGEDISFIIEELSAPEKFDPIEHMNGGGKACYMDAGWFYFCKNSSLYTHDLNSGLEKKASNGVYELFMERLFHGTIKPYVEPEPTPMELIEKARDALDGGQQDSADGDAIYAALDAFEKSLGNERTMTNEDWVNVK